MAAANVRVERFSELVSEASCSVFAITRRFSASASFSFAIRRSRSFCFCCFRLSIIATFHLCQAFVRPAAAQPSMMPETPTSKPAQHHVPATASSPGHLSACILTDIRKKIEPCRDPALLGVSTAQRPDCRAITARPHVSPCRSSLQLEHSCRNAKHRPKNKLNKLSGQGSAAPLTRVTLVCDSGWT